MERNFEVTYECTEKCKELYNEDDLKIIETKLIYVNSPIFNLNQNPDPSTIVKRERARCREIAGT
jgi:hypothetical protein